jgi:hypothetical protein
MALQDLNSLSRQRLDFSEGPEGQAIATLTVSLGDGSVHRYKAESTEQEVNELAKGIANAEINAMKISGEIAGMGEDEIAGLFGKIWKGVKSVGKVARKIASSKVFKMAGKGLTMIAPALGPFAPAALAVGGGMMVASKLSDASIAAEAGAKKVARNLGLKGKAASKHVAAAVAKSIRAQGRRPRRGLFGRLSRWGNSKRKSAMARAAGRRPAPRKRRRPKKGVAYWRKRALLARKRALAASAKRRAMAARRRPAFPRYASSPYPQPRYFAPWAGQQRGLPMGYNPRPRTRPGPYRPAPPMPAPKPRGAFSVSPGGLTYKPRVAPRPAMGPRSLFAPRATPPMYGGGGYGYRA